MDGAIKNILASEDGCGKLDMKDYQKQMYRQSAEKLGGGRAAEQAPASNVEFPVDFDGMRKFLAQLNAKGGDEKQPDEKEQSGAEQGESERSEKDTAELGKQILEALRQEREVAKGDEVAGEIEVDEHVTGESDEARDDLALGEAEEILEPQEVGMKPEEVLEKLAVIEPEVKGIFEQSRMGTAEFELAASMMKTVKTLERRQHYREAMDKVPSDPEVEASLALQVLNSGKTAMILNNAIVQDTKNQDWAKDLSEMEKLNALESKADELCLRAIEELNDQAFYVYDDMAREILDAKIAQLKAEKAAQEQGQNESLDV